MASAYLASGELSSYGVPNATTAQITSASAIVDAYLRRPEGLQWLPDAAGYPCYMAAASASFTLKSATDFAAGENVSVPVQYAPGMLSSIGSVGDVVIIDSGVDGKTEACVIASVSAGAIVFAKVANSHSVNAKLEFGLVIREQRTLPKGRSITRVSNWPIVRIISAVGTYRYGRRSSQFGRSASNDQDLLAMTQVFGGAPPWVPFDVSMVDFDPISGEVWVPAGGLMSNYSDVRLFYVAGFSQTNIPAAIKSATAAAITAGLNSADLAGGLKSARAGDTAIERFGNSILDNDLRNQSDMFKARLVI